MPKLFVAATPIGNLSDATPRLLETLAAVRLIAAEDTRVTGNLLRHFGIQTPLTSLHRHNEAGKAAAIVARMLAEDIDVAVVTDAGTPAISDPGCGLVREAVASGIEVLAIAGPSAMAAALSVSGFDAREFAFYGFLPRTQGDLKKKLLAMAEGPKVTVIHESPHRVTALMEAVADTLPGCLASVSCDLTKLYEKTTRGDARAVAEALRCDPKTEKGEYCIVLDLSHVILPEKARGAEPSLAAMLMDALLKGASPQDAVAEAVAGGARKNDAKRALIDIQRWQNSEKNTIWKEM